MISSMTGYGRAQKSRGKECLVTVEIKSVNNRFLSVNTRMPETFAHKSQEIENLVRQNLSRGSVSYFLRVSCMKTAELFKINHKLLEKYVEAVRRVRKKSGQGDSVSIEALMNLPGVIESADTQDNLVERAWPIIAGATKEALEQLKKMRLQEGRHIAKDFSARVSKMDKLLKSIQKRVPTVVKEYQKRLHARSRELLKGSGVKLGGNDLLKEVALFAEKSDIEEEIVRFASHLAQVGSLIQSSESVGRQLEFISQEMLREVNTMSSKCNDASLFRVILNLKNEVDKFREQVFNVE